MPGADGEITLSFVTDGLRAAVRGLAARPEQQRFAGPAAPVLDAVDGDVDRRPVAILRDGTPVGFFVLHTGPRAAPLAPAADEVLLRGFFVDAAAQGAGVASRGLAALPAFVRRHLPGVRRVVLTVNLRNPPAISVYKKAGFADTGERYHGGTQGPQHVFVLAV